MSLDTWFVHYKTNNDMKETTKRKYLRPEVMIIGILDECQLLAGSNPANLGLDHTDAQICDIDSEENWEKICECEGDYCYYKKGYEP